MPKLAGGGAVKAAPPSTPAPRSTPAESQATLDLDDPFLFVPLEEAEDVINALIYGPEGTGKTTDVAFMANTIPEGHPGKVLVVNAESGLKKGALAKRGVAIDKVVYWPSPEAVKAGLKIDFDMLEKLFFKLESDLAADPQSWYGVGFDSGTEIARAVMESVQAKAIAKARAQNQDRDRWAVDRDDYRVMGDQVATLIRRFRDLPIHFIITALEREDEDKQTGLQVFGPAFNPGLSNNIRGYVDLVLRVKADEVMTDDGPFTEFRAATRPSTRWRAKDRFDALPPVLYDPNFARIHAYVNGEITEDEDPVQQAGMERRAQAEAIRLKIEAEKTERKRAAKKAVPARAATPSAADTNTEESK